LENFTPIIPESLVDYYMVKCGVNCDDVRLKRLVALIIQKFITDVTNDAMNYNKLRTGSGNANSNKDGGAGKKGGSASTFFTSSTQQKKPTLAMEDLVSARQDYGINIKRPYYYS